MTNWRRWADWTTVWLFSLLIEAAVAAVRFIRGRSRDEGGTP